MPSKRVSRRFLFAGVAASALIAPALGAPAPDWVPVPIPPQVPARS